MRLRRFLGASGPSPTTGRPPAAFLALAGAVIVAAVGVRLATLDRQSYWIDEIFSVNESSGSLQHLLRVASGEVHTPFYAGLLWVWMAIGGTGEIWTRLLSTLFAVAAVVVAYRGLRPVPLNEHVRWALTVATAASGTSIAYSLDTRNYALLMLGSVGVTVATLRAGVLLLDGDDVPRRTYLAWTGWIALAATAHLFGAVLALAATTVLTAVTVHATRRGGDRRERARRILAWPVLAGAGCAVQGLWLVRAVQQSAVTEGTDWIKAPGPSAVWDLVTTTFSSGAMTPHKDGFAWASPVGVVVAAVLTLTAAVLGLRSRRSGSSTRSAPPVRSGEASRASTESRSAAILFALVVIVVVPAFAISQWIHLWTLRNLVIVAPALSWGVICLAAALTGTAAGRRAVATVVVVLLGISLVPIAIGVSQPYKTDFRGLFDYLMTVRAKEPDATFVFLGREPPWDLRTASERPGNDPAQDLRTASDLPYDDPAWDALYGRVVTYPSVGVYLKTAGKAVEYRSGPQIVISSYRVADPRFEQRMSALLKRLGPSTCRRVPIYGIVVVRCG